MYKPPIRGKTKKKEEPQNITGVAKLVVELNSLKENLIEKVDKKLEEVNVIVSDIKDAAQEMRIDHKGADADEERIARNVLSKIRVPKDGKEVNEEALTKRILSQIPKENDIARKVLASIPKPKSTVKIIQEKAEIDPIAVIEKILTLPPNKFKLKSSNIDGLEQSINAMNSQLGRGYLHGGGASRLVDLNDVDINQVTLQDGYVLTYNAITGKWDAEPGGGGGGGSNIYNEYPTGTINGINTTFTTSQPFVSTTTRVYLNGARQALNIDYTEASPNGIVFVVAPETDSILFLDYEYTGSVVLDYLLLPDGGELLLPDGTGLLLS